MTPSGEFFDAMNVKRRYKMRLLEEGNLGLPHIVSDLAERRVLICEDECHCAVNSWTLMYWQGWEWAKPGGLTPPSWCLKPTDGHQGRRLA